MEDIKRALLHSLLEVIILSFLMMLPVITVYLDLTIGDRTITELSFVEVTQETLLFVSVVLFWIGVLRDPQARGFMVLVAGLLSCMFIRELDYAFDQITHGFWFYPAMLMALGSILYAAINRDTISLPMVYFTGTRSYVFLAVGLLITLVFSRVFGSGNLVWKEALGSSYTAHFRSVIQEGLELFGYVFVFYGACLSRLHAGRRRNELNPG